MGRKLRATVWTATALAALIGGAPLIARLEFGRTVDHLEQAGGRVHISTLGHIVGVSFAGATVSDGELSWLGGLDRLCRVSLAGTPVTAAGLDEMGELPQLADIDLSQTTNAAGSLSHLQHFPALETLRLHDCAWVSDQSLAGLPAMANLTLLDLSATPITDEGLRQLVPGPHLRFINLAQCRSVTDQGLTRLLLLPQLKGLQLQGTQVTLPALRRAAAERPDLRVDFEACLWEQLAPFRASGAGFERDEEGGQIVGLRLQHPPPSLPYELLAELKDVREVSFEGREIDDRILQSIGLLPELRSLHLKGTSVTGAGLRGLAAVPHLESLSLCRKLVTRDVVQSLEALARLRDLGLTWSVVGPDALASVGDLPQLQTLNLEGARASRFAVARLQRQHPGLKVTGIEARRRHGRHRTPGRPPVDLEQQNEPRRS